MSISAIIPAYNEGNLLPITIRALRKIADIDQIIVVDDGSSDDTAQMAKIHADQVIALPKNRGKGEALRQGVELSTGDILLFVDSDLGQSAELAHYLILPVIAGQADMSVAIFPPSTVKAGFGMVKGLARWGIRGLTGCELDSPLCGQRAMTREAVGKINSWNGRFGIEVGMTIDILRSGLSLIEVPIPFTHRETGRNWSGFIHRGKQCIDVGRMLSQKWYLS